MNLFKSMIIAFSMYSKIPMPKTEFKEADMKYVMCFFPFIGIVIGGLTVIWYRLALAAGLGDFMRSAVLTLIPAAVTGGIHIDGFMDTVDAKSSYGSHAKKMDILKDPHVGAFAVIGIICYVLLTAACFSEVTYAGINVVGIGFILSRSLSGFFVVALPPAKKDGIVETFSSSASKKICRIVLAILIMLSSFAMIITGGASGAAAVCGAALVCIYFKMGIIKEFKGITGDLAGYFLQICELSILAAVVITAGI